MQAQFTYVSNNRTNQHTAMFEQALKSKLQHAGNRNKNSLSESTKSEWSLNNTCAQRLEKKKNYISRR